MLVCSPYLYSLAALAVFEKQCANGINFVAHYHRSETHMLVQGLEPNTKYEFAVRLHVDQLSSPWSPVVYHSTLPDGKEGSSLVGLSKCAKKSVKNMYVTLKRMLPWL